MLLTYDAMALDPARRPRPEMAWSPGLGGHRLLFIARPDARMREAFDTVTREHGIQARVGLALFPLVNWHQTLSDRFIDTPEARAKLLRAGGQVQAEGFTLALDQWRIAPNARDSANVDLRCSQPSAPLACLFAGLRRAMGEQGLESGADPVPHVTLSYRFAHHARRLEVRPVRPIQWTIDSFELVVGGGDPYRYRMLGRWPLRPSASSGRA